jgi:squalene-hopene/tetraprenyl-beta-curcumene cyclase
VTGRETPDRALEATRTDDVAAAVERARGALLSLQLPDGSWDAELHTSVIHDVEDLLLRQFLGIRRAGETVESARWIRSQQRPDGTWSNSPGGPPELSVTVAGYIALRLAGDGPDADHLVRARDFIGGAGGVAATTVFVRTWLALFGQWPWASLPAMPPQFMYLPRRFPLSIYSFASWVRTVSVPMMVIGATRPRAELGLDIGAELPTGGPRRLPPPARVVRSLRRLPLRRRGLRAAARWIEERQEQDGSWYSSRPPVVWSVIALRALGYPVSHPVIETALASLDRLTIRTNGASGPSRRAVIFRGANWDTATAVMALTAAGRGPDDQELLRAGRYLLGQQVTVRGDWSSSRPRLPAGGWTFFRGNQRYPDVDDTAMVLQALRRIDLSADHSAVEDAVRRGTTWMVGMQCRGGGWAAFDADNTSKVPDRLLTYTAATDRPCPEITAHVLDSVLEEEPADKRVVAAAVAYLLRTQLPDGSWAGRWMVHHVYASAAAVAGLRRAGLPLSHPAITRAVGWLEAHQNDDGGWGEDLRSFTDPAWVGRGSSTASQTAWALLGLLAADPAGTSVRRGVAWLLERQRPDGNWDEAGATGVIGGGTGYIPLRYDLSRLVWPLMALGGYARQQSSG